MPVLPVPDESAALWSLPSSNFQCATSPATAVAVGVGVGVAVAVEVAVVVAVAVAVLVGVGLGPGVSVAVGVAVAAQKVAFVSTVPRAMKPEGSYWLLYSVWIQFRLRTELERRTSSIIPSKVLAVPSVKSLPTLMSEPVIPA